MSTESTAFHFLAGGIGGSVGAVVTIPLEVVKTRLQSSVATFQMPATSRHTPQNLHVNSSYPAALITANSNPPKFQHSIKTANVFVCLKYIVRNEGVPSLFRGLGPTLVGVAPSRAIYFFTYARAKSYWNNVLYPDTSIVHICSAFCAGFTASTLTNPIWFIKTRLQLDQKTSKTDKLTVLKCIRKTFKSHGILGFYKGVTASYYGISETMIHFVIYEEIKSKIHEHRMVKKPDDDPDQRGLMDFIEYMGAGAVSKTCATCVAYPHEVARTRLRQEGSQYRSFWQTLSLVFHEDGVRGIYRGLTVQLIRQIPNTAVMMSTYEAVLYLCSVYLEN